MQTKLWILLLGASLLLAACGGREESFEERLRPVRYVTVDDGGDYRNRSFSGTSKSVTESRLSFKVAGTVTRLPVQIGQRLEAGELIAELDPASYVLQAQQAQASLVEAEANNRRAAANYERTKGLYANDNASLNDLESARAQAESAEAVVASASKALEIARLNVSYTKLRADGDCSIAALEVEVNENVSPGQQVALVSCGSAYEVTVDLPESLIGGVTMGTPVSVQFGAIPGQEFEGTVAEIAVASVRDTATFPVVIRINGSHPSLRSGMAADVTFQFDSTETNGTRFLLPVSAVIRDPGGTYVFVAEPADTAGEGIVSRREVELGDLSQAGVEVTGGLELGDRVVTAGISVIRPGQRVLLPDAD